MMGTTISLSSLIQEENAVESFKSAYAEYSGFSKDQHLHLWELISNSEVIAKKRKGFRMTNWTSGKSIWATLEIDPNKLDEYSLSALEGEGRLEAHFEFASDNAHEFYLDLELFGKKYEGGHAYLNDGFVRATCSYNNLYRPVLDLIQTKQIPVEKLASDIEFRNAVLVYENTVRLLFLTYCKGNTKAKHCFGYLESGVALPPFCFAISHNDITEYILDYYRIYFGLKYKVHPSILYRINKVEDFFQFESKQDHSSNLDSYYDTLRRTLPEAFRFFDGLKLEDIEFLNDLPAEQIRQLSIMTIDKLANGVTGNSLSFETLEGKYCIVSAPYDNLCGFYEEFYLVARERHNKIGDFLDEQR